MPKEPIQGLEDALKQRELLYRLGQRALSYSELATADDVADDFEEIIQEWINDQALSE